MADSEKKLTSDSEKKSWQRKKVRDSEKKLWQRKKVTRCDSEMRYHRKTKKMPAKDKTDTFLIRPIYL